MCDRTKEGKQLNSSKTVLLIVRKVHICIQVIIFAFSFVNKMETRLKKTLKTCGICLDKITNCGKINSCQHLFCHDCISNWSKIQNTCPLCKKRFTKLQATLCRINYNSNQRRKRTKIDIKQRNQNQIDTQITFTFDDLTGELFRMLEQQPQLFLSFLESVAININVDLDLQEEHE